MRFLAANIYRFLEEAGCTYEGDRIPTGEAWLTPGMQVFFLPDPDLIDGVHWFDADVIVDNLKDRWVGFAIPDTMKRYP